MRIAGPEEPAPFICDLTQKRTWWIPIGLAKSKLYRNPDLPMALYKSFQELLLEILRKLLRILNSLLILCINSVRSFVKVKRLCKTSSSIFATVINVLSRALLHTLD